MLYVLESGWGKLTGWLQQKHTLLMGSTALRAYLALQLIDIGDVLAFEGELDGVFLSDF